VNVAQLDLPAIEERPEIEQLRLAVRAFLAEQQAAGAFRPAVDSWLSGVDPAFSKRLGDQGWLGMKWPKEYGGHERSTLERYAVVEELLAAGAPVAAHWIADRQSGSNILAFGSDELKRRILPRIAAGECFFAIGMSEADAGSDLAAVRSRAHRDADGNWILNGTKIWTSNAQHAHYAIVLVRTDPEAGKRSRDGLTQLVVDLSLPGLKVNPIAILDGSEHLNELVFEDVVVPAGMLLGREGEGWQQVTAELAYERSGPERFLSTFTAISAFAEYVRVTRDPHQQAVLGRLVARLLSLRQLSRRVAGALDRKELPNVQAALVKDLGTRFESDSIDEIRAATGVVPVSGSADPLAHALAVGQLHSPAFTLRGGTNEILRSIVARGLGLRR
jgi:alkylation response protein AidB-like acyl-CoA dehydrogenase